MHASSHNTRAEARTYGLTKIRATVDDRGVFCENRRRELLGGLHEGMHPQKILKSEDLKTPLPALSD